MGTGKISNNNNKNTGTKFEEWEASKYLWINIREFDIFFTLESKVMSSYYERNSYKEKRD